MKKICIIHPEGNINNNPNLTGIVEILCENGYEVDIYSSKRTEIYQKSPCKGSNLFLEDCTNQEELEKILSHKFTEQYFLIIGIDIGIIEAELLSKINNVPYGLISYEIYFADEIGIKNKKLEISACQGLDFVIVQDEIRAKFLIEENKIITKNILYIPVAGRGVRNIGKQKFWHEKYNISADHKIAVYMGSVDTWTMIEEIIESAETIPNDWHIVIHNRYGSSLLSKKYRELINRANNVHLSEDIFETFEQMKDALSSADLGLAFYNSTKCNKWTGKNIQYVGLSSGKISTYLQHGVPIATNIGFPFKECINKYDIGLYLESVYELGSNLKLLRKDDLTQNCFLFFDKYLNLDKTIGEFLRYLSNLKSPINKIDNDLCKKLLISNTLYINQEIIQELVKYRDQLLKYNRELESMNLASKDMIYKLKNSISYRLGNSLLKPFSLAKQNIKKAKVR